MCQHHALGGEGAIDLANAVIKASKEPPNFKFLYELDLPIKVRQPASPPSHTKSSSFSDVRLHRLVEQRPVVTGTYDQNLPAVSGSLSTKVKLQIFKGLISI